MIAVATVVEQLEQWNSEFANLSSVVFDKS